MQKIVTHCRVLMLVRRVQTVSELERQKKKSLGGRGICSPPAQRNEDQGVRTGVCSTLTVRQGPWMDNE